MINLCTKFEVPIATNGGAKCTNGVVWSGWGTLKVMGNVTVR